LREPLEGASRWRFFDAYVFGSKGWGCESIRAYCLIFAALYNAGQLIHL